jgi:excisionase family DNA binding protein
MAEAVAKIKAHQLLVVKEVCEVTRLSKSKVYQLLADGVLHRVRFPGCTKVLISAAEVQRVIDAAILVES